MKMQCNFDAAVNDLDGKPIVVGLEPRTFDVLEAIAKDFTPEQKADLQKRVDEVAGKPLTLASACVGGLLGAYEDEKNLGDQERMRRYELARDINKGGVRAFNTTERDLMKKLVGKRFAGSLVGPAVWTLLESADKLAEAVEEKA